LSRRQFWKIQRQVDDLAADIVRDPVPDTIWSGTAVIQRLRAALTVSVIPAVERGAGDTEFVQGALGRQMRLLDQLDDLGLLGSRISHASSSPSPNWPRNSWAVSPVGDPTPGPAPANGRGAGSKSGRAEAACASHPTPRS